MKIKDNFMLRQIAGTWLAVPIGERVVDFNGIITLSESGAFIWRMLENGASREEIVSSILDKYEIDEETARKDTEAFLEQLRRDGIAEE